MPAKAVARSVRRRKTSQKRTRFPLKPLVFLLLFIFIVFGTARILSSWKNRIWIPETRFTVVVAKENPTIYSYNPQIDELLVITIPKNTEVEAAWGYGRWFVGSLWDLGFQEGLEGELLAFSLTKNFGLPIDGWISSTGEGLFKESPLGINNWVQAFVLGSAKTNLTFFDRLNLLAAGDGKKEIDLVQEKVLVKVRLADGLEGFDVVPEQAKAVFERFKDERVFQEGKTLAVVNTTGEKGLAAEAMRVANVLGVRTIKSENKGVEVEGCLVKTSQANFESLAVQRLVQIFRCQKEKTDGILLGDIELILGKKFAETF